jgi:tetratricopeptide (TPR) repeat protein
MVDSLISVGRPVEWRGPRGRVRSWLVIAWSATFVLIGTGVDAWWRSRADRHLAEGERLLEENQPDEAIRWLGVPEATYHTRDRAFLLRARAALARNSPSDAMDPLFQVNAAGPWAADAEYWKGRTLEAVQQTAEAIECFHTAANLRPNDSEIHCRLAKANDELGATAHALTELKIVFRLRPGDAWAPRSIGLIFLRHAQYDQARQAYEQSLKLDPDQPQVRLELATALVKLGQLDEAERQLELCQGRTVTAEHAELLAHCRLARGDALGCRATLDMAIAEAPKHAGLLALRARLELQEGRTAEALIWLNRTLDADPYNWEANDQRGLALRRLGRTEEAEAAVARARELRDTNAELLRLRADAARHPSDAEIRYRIGTLCARLGNTGGAASWYVAALACDPSHAGARRALEAVVPSASGQTFPGPR